MCIPHNTQVRTCSFYTPTKDVRCHIYSVYIITNIIPPAPTKGSASEIPVIWVVWCACELGVKRGSSVLQGGSAKAPSRLKQGSSVLQGGSAKASGSSGAVASFKEDQQKRLPGSSGAVASFKEDQQKRLPGWSRAVPSSKDDQLKRLPGCKHLHSQMANLQSALYGPGPLHVNSNAKGPERVATSVTSVEDAPLRRPALERERAGGGRSPNMAWRLKASDKKLWGNIKPRVSIPKGCSIQTQSSLVAAMGLEFQNSLEAPLLPHHWNHLRGGTW